MTDNNINLYISSKNRVDGDASSFSVVVPNGLLSCKKNENWKLNVNGFYLINSWYNIKSNYNNHFIVIYNSISYDIYLTEGSPNVYELLQDLNEKLATYMTVSYNRAKNKFTYKNNNATPCRIIPITAGDFLGFENFTDTNIDTLGVESDDPINVQGDKMLFVKLYASDFTLANNSIDNLFTGDYLPNTIIFSVPINVPPQSLISYNNEDGGNSFTHLITQSRDDIDHFSLIVVNEKGEEIKNMTDYIILLQFQKVIFYEETFLSYVETLKDLIENIYNYIIWFGKTYYNQLVL